jgi:HD-like signal output (HDOD) protein
MAPRIPGVSTTNLNVPTLPAVVARLEALIADPDAGPSDVGALINEDPPLAGKVLRIANSTFYGLAEPCSSVEKACSVLGLKLVHTMIVQASVIAQFEHLREIGLDLGRLWRHSVLVGRVCSILARGSKSAAAPNPDEAYLAGLLHDVGQVVLLDNLREKYVAMHRQAAVQSLPLVMVERRDLGTTHAEIGAAVVNTWKLSNSVRIGVQLHHARRDADFSVPAACLTIKANLLVDRVCAGDRDGALAVLDPVSEKTLVLAPTSLTEAVEYVERHAVSALGEAA